jgi:hypothetical protein
MKKLLPFLCCLFTICVHAQQKLNTFHVVDNKTQKPIPATSITIVRAKLSITTEKDGIFVIPGNLEKMRDSVILYAQNYELFKITLAQLNGMDTIRLSKITNNLVTARLNYKDDTLLNNYNRSEIAYYAGLNTETAQFDYLQLAQRFNVQKPGIRLKSVVVNKLSFNVVYSITDPDSQYDSTELEHTTYRVHIYDVNTLTGGPGKDLSDKIIEVKILDSKQSNFNLKKYNIIIPNKTFFVAIEWLRDYYNLGYVMVHDKKLKRNVQQLNYRPTIGISPITGKKLNIWGLDYKHNWKPYTYFMPFGTDLAIKAGIEY